MPDSDTSPLPFFNDSNEPLMERKYITRIGKLAVCVGRGYRDWNKDQVEYNIEGTVYCHNYHGFCRGYFLPTNTDMTYEEKRSFDVVGLWPQKEALTQAKGETDAR